MTHINHKDIRELGDEFGTPLYVYDKQKITENYNRLNNAFVKHYPKTKIHFSVKSNSNVHILNIFQQLGSGADCSSPNEVMLAQKAGFADQDIIYTGNYESRDDFVNLKNHSVQINLDDSTSFDRVIEHFIPKIVSFRINPGIGKGGHEGITTGGTDAKFGIPYEYAAEAYKKAKQQGVSKFGIHMMTGSNNLEPYHFAQTVEKLMLISKNIFDQIGAKPDFVDIGGGFGIPYEDDELPLDIEKTAELVTEIFTEKCQKYGFGEPYLYLEPGRYLIADAGWLITQVTGTKHSYKNFVGVDAGMSTLLRPALYGAFHRTYLYGKEGEDTVVNLCGQICENSDVFAKSVHLPVAEIGDLMIIRDVGAYGYVMSSNYNNRLRPAEVLIDNSKPKLIRRRETFDDLISLIP
ncbi:MAG: diaminopimelate decarboxylase [Ignavibacteriae bacterium HGW-Ignavibacteriae-1]|jgi:diaminopimelate decarboxylase|nr:MAG: diaminopimelate decarboxylase [Ignavibacteriae bacterium HGW-Ignavibacteriae-1]